MPTIEVTSNIAEVVRALGKMRQDLRPAALEPAVKELGKEADRYFRQTTKTWEHQPTFTTRVVSNASGTSVVTSTDDKIYGYLDLGTGKAGGWRADDYPIVPHGNYPLKFASGYQAKTRSAAARGNAVPIARNGGPFGAVVRARKVMHPGIKPRRFVRSIQQRMDKRSPEIIRKYIRKWASKKYV
jgi:hypothetical protein